MNCPTCSTSMKPLFTGFYCPKDCDKRVPLAPPLVRQILRKVPKSDREHLDRWLATVMGINNIYIGWKPNERVVMLSTNPNEPAQSWYPCSWVIKVSPENNISVLKNREGGFSLRDIPDYEEP